MNVLERNKLIHKHLLDYCVILSAEADKIGIIGFEEATKILYDKTEEIRALADEIFLSEK